MSTNDKIQATVPVPGSNVPWYRQFWPWFIIALPVSAVIASFISLWLAVSNPDQLVVTDDEYRKLKSELKAQLPVNENNQVEAGKPDPKSN